MHFFKVTKLLYWKISEKICRIILLLKTDKKTDMKTDEN